MADGQLRFWAAGELAYESEAWPQAFLFLFCNTLARKTTTTRCVDTQSVKHRPHASNIVDGIPDFRQFVYEILDV